MSAHGQQVTGDALSRAIAFSHGVLPDQGPIGVFVHHNTLHAFQHLPFHEAVQTGAAVAGARPYLSADEFREAYARGRITADDVECVLQDELGEQASTLSIFDAPRIDIWRALMVDSIDVDDAAGLRYAIRTGTAASSADAERWNAAHDRIVHAERPSAARPSAARPSAAHPSAARPSAERPSDEDTRRLQRHRDLLLHILDEDTDRIVHPEMTRLCAGFLDQGQAHRVLPGRSRGFLRAVAALYASGSTAPRGCPGVVEEFRRIAETNATARDVISESIELLGVSEHDRESYLVSTALALPGWAGMFSRLERHPHEHADGAPTRLEEFLAVRMVFDRQAVSHCCVVNDLPTTWHALREHVPAVEQRDPILDAHLLWGIARAAGACGHDIRSLTEQQLALLWTERREFSPLRRRKVWQEAYERRYRRQILDAMAARRQHGLYEPAARRTAQVVFCIDEREESMRRAIEEQGPEFETFGVAGFFGVAIDYQGLYDAHPAAHCPVVVTPAHEVHESAHPDEASWHSRRLNLRQRVHLIERLIGRSSRGLTGGAGISFVLGPLAGAAVATRIMAPRSSLAIRDRIKQQFLPRPRTQLSALREEWQQASQRGKPVGFSLSESVERVTGVLRSIGLVSDFAPIVVVLGHGSTSLNNPHESAHDCGACGGRRGGANARLFAEMANRSDVRAELRVAGIVVPDDTVFIGGLHDTADDKVTLYDIGAVPEALEDDFENTCIMLERARRESARERARRFEDAPLGITPEQALAHVEARASHLAQPRPEYGHCTNAIAVVGRRTLTRGVHLDRRPFLVSYDPTIDSDAAILERILAAVGPVGAGISLEYYFSSVDNERFGCGTKLPHNVTGLLGVMNGHQGDLRTGLPLQMVELHEPMRLLLIVEATPDSLLTVASRQAEVRELVVNEWVQLVSVDPESGAMHVFHRGAFVPYLPGGDPLPEVERSVDWHGNRRDFVAPALVRAAMTTRSAIVVQREVHHA